MIKIEDIEPGKSYACKYIDLTGTECVAVIHTRDTAAKLVEESTKVTIGGGGTRFPVNSSGERGV